MEKRGVVDYDKMFSQYCQDLSGINGNKPRTTAADVTAEPPMNSIIHIISLLTVTVP